MVSPVSRSFVVACSAWLMLGAVAGTQEQRSGSVASTEAYAVAGELMSPYCPGRTLAACPSPDAAVLRAEIAERLSKGESRESIVRDLEARFGPDIRGVPEPIGVGVALWVLPVVLGFLVLFAAIAGWGLRHRPEPNAVRSGPNAEDAALRERLEEELDRLS